MIVREGRSTSSFVNLPEDIHFKIAKIIDTNILSNPSSFHAEDTDLSQIYKGSKPHTLVKLVRQNSQPDLTLARLALVCKRLQRIYAPYSTWKCLSIEAKSPSSARSLGEKFELSPCLTRVLKYPETGIYARSLYIEGKRSHKECFVKSFAHGNLANFDLFLANTPRLETIRCILEGDEASGYDPHLPIEFFKSLSSLASLRYLYLGQFVMDYKLSTPFPSLHQVRILRFTPSPFPETNILCDLLRSMPNIHTLYVNTSLSRMDWVTDNVLRNIEVRCHFSPTTFLRGIILRILSYKMLFLGGLLSSQTAQH
jgi:hypothetical protein